jgi:enterochelin esterase-like enzyme
MVAARSIAAAGVLAGIALGARATDAFAATLRPHAEVRGSDLSAPDVRRKGGAWAAMAWDDLGRTVLEPGRYEVRQRVVIAEAGDAVQIPPCAGRIAVRLDSHGMGIGAEPGPVVVPVLPGAHEVVVEVAVSGYERRIACGQRLRIGKPVDTIDGLGMLEFDSPHAARGGGRAVVYVPTGANLHRISHVLVGLHPWNGSIWTYAAYEELLRGAQTSGVLLLMPSGLGNSLYTADAEDEVLRAIDALASVVVVPSSVDSVHELTASLWGASMGGAGATTIAFHHPDRFAAVTSFFGDSRYDLSTYVRTILVDERAAHWVNALDVVDNARNLPVWLIHGEDDKTSPIRQSEILAAALHERGYPVRFDRVAGLGHSGALVARFLPQIVGEAATAHTDSSPARVTYRSVRPSDVGAYGVRIERANPTGDAFIDLERRADGVHVIRSEGVREFVVAPRPVATPP